MASCRPSARGKPDFTGCGLLPAARPGKASCNRVMPRIREAASFLPGLIPDTASCDSFRKDAEGGEWLEY
jgi:hypothetical protein